MNFELQHVDNGIVASAWSLLMPLVQEQKELHDGFSGKTLIKVFTRTMRLSPDLSFMWNIVELNLGT